MKTSTFVAAGFALCSMLLCACGPDVLSAAAGGAASSAAAAKQAQEQKARIEAQLKAAQEAEQKRLQGVTEQADGQSR
jgi:hypothetical protein